MQPKPLSRTTKTTIRPGAHRPVVFGLQEWSVVWGVYVGNGCVSAEDPLEWTEIWAHAHNNTDDEWFGWICIADIKKAFTKRGNPSLVMKHEVAHLLVPNKGHTQRWREVLTAIGGGAEALKYPVKKKLIPQNFDTKLEVPSSLEVVREENLNETSSTTSNTSIGESAT